MRAFSAAGLPYAWDLEGNRDETTCIDLDPVKMYRESPVVDDPLEAVA